MTIRTRRTALIAGLLVLGFIALIAVAVQVRRHSAPEAARLLPQTDAIVYFDLGTVRKLASYKAGSTPHDPEYQKMIDATGFEPERDLDQVAVAIHATPGKETRFSYVFVGHYDFGKVSTYLRQIAGEVERYRDIDIYHVPVENRTVRIALLGLDMAAISNTDDPANVHGMIDRYKEIALPFGGPGILQ